MTQRTVNVINVVLGLAIVAVVITAGPLTAGDGDEATRRLFRNLSGAEEVYDFATVSEAAEQVSGVVLATVLDVRPGRVFPLDRPDDPDSVPYGELVVRVDQRLSGSIQEGDEVVMDFPLPHDSLTELELDLQDRQAVFFLQDKYDEIRSLGVEGQRAEAERGYFMLRDYDGALVNFDGTAVAYFSLEEIEGDGSRVPTMHDSDVTDMSTDSPESSQAIEPSNGEAGHEQSAAGFGFDGSSFSAAASAISDTVETVD